MGVLDRAKTVSGKFKDKMVKGIVKFLLGKCGNCEWRT